MTTSSQTPSAAYQSCVDEVLRQSPYLIDRWCSQLVDAMNERFILIQHPAERQQIETAIAALKKNRASIAQVFPQELKKAIADEDAAGRGTARQAVNTARTLSSVSFDQLELMGDSQVQDAVESARLQQIVKLTCEAGLANFSARLSTAQGFLVVKADSNSLRPEIMIQALLRLLQVIPLTSRSRAFWLFDGARIMGKELQSLYVSLDKFLAGLGVAPAAYGVIATPESWSERALLRERMEVVQSSRRAPDPVSSIFGGLAAHKESPQASRKQLLTLDHLHHLLVGDYENSTNEFSPLSGYGSDEVVHQEFSHTVPAALETLTELEGKGIASARAKATALPPSQSAVQMRAYLRTDAKSLGQSLAIEVVGLMIEQMANDERLLMPVRQVIANAEPAYLRLAVTDPRFFSDKSHPARRLLETITSTSLGYAGVNEPGFADFMQSLQEVAILLTEEHASDAEHFSKLLQDFERKQSRNTPQNRQAQRRAVQALVQAEERNLMAQKIAAEIRARPDFVEASRTIGAFLTGPWAQVMAKERLLSAYSEPGSTKAVFSLTLGDVLWSLDLAQTSSHRKRFLEIIPGLLKSLRDGLLSIDFPLEQSRAFFDEIMAAHQAGFKRQPDLPAAAPQKSHSLGKMFSAEEDPDITQPWLAPTEVQHSGFMADWDSPSLPVLGAQPLRPREQAPAAASALSRSAESAELNLGDWIELLVDMQWLRAQLTWVSPHNTLFMFTSAGGRKHSMTARVLSHMLNHNLIKVVSQQGVLDGALDGVARTALQNSVQSVAVSDRL
ncbi:MAG: DUF1631 family protein [Polaromonas sp.]